MKNKSLLKLSMRNIKVNSPIEKWNSLIELRRATNKNPSGRNGNYSCKQE